MDPAGELRASVTTGASGDMSCTVAETNRIRAALGLRPLRPGKPAAAVEVARPAVVDAANGGVRERVKKAREARLARRGAMGAVSIAERARTGEDDDGDDDTDDDVEGWVARMRKRGLESGKAQRAVEGMVTERHEKGYGEADLVGMQVAHAPGVLKEGEQMVFTLADTDVLAADEGGEGVADLLENAHARDAEKTQRNVQRRKGAVAAAAYDATDTKEFEVKIGAQGGRLASDEGSGDDTRAVGSFRIGSEAAKAAEKARAEALEEKRRAEVREKLRVSAEVAEEPEFETDYMTKDEFEAAYGKQRAKMSNLFTRNGRRGRKKRRRRTRDADDEEAVKSEARPLPDTESKPVSRGHMQTVRDAAALEFRADYGDGGQRGASDENEEEEEEKALYASLARARKKAKDAHAQTSVQRIMDAMNKATGRGSDEESDNDGPLGEAAQLVYDEMEQFVRNIPAAVSDDEDDDDEDDEEEGEGEEEEDDTMLVEPKDEEEKLGQETAVEQKGEEGGSQSADAIAPVEGDGAMGYKRNNSEAETDGTRPYESAAKRTTPLAATLGLPNDIEDQAPMGIAAALARFRSRGELKHKTRQEGRAHDKRYDWNQATTGTGSTAPSGRREIKIVYTDEYGRELTQKEAFRVLCHKFHGKGPGKNKREKRLRQHLESLKVRNMASDDTPLASAAALEAETRETGRAHVVLSGSAAILRAPSKTVLAKQTTAPPKSAAPAREKDHVAKKQSNGHVLPSNAPLESAKRPREDDKVAFSFGTAPAASKRTRR